MQTHQLYPTEKLLSRVHTLLDKNSIQNMKALNAKKPVTKREGSTQGEVGLYKKNYKFLLSLQSRKWVA